MSSRPVSASQIASEFGFTARHWIRQAANGRVPGAYQPSGPKGHWLFDRAVFEKWYRSTVREATWQPSISAARRGGHARNATTRNSGSLSRQEIDQLLRSVSGSGSMNSMQPAGADVLAFRSARQRER